MARGRVALTDKEEKILLQAQLMGLSTSSMVKIGNRLRALEKEREDKALIDQTCQGFSWVKTPTGWIVITPDNYHCEFTDEKRGKSTWYERVYTYKLKVYKPGTRFKPKFFKERSIRVSDDWRAKLCPAGSKNLYGMIRFCSNIKYELVNATEMA
jgi:hypothetical protein